MNTKLSKAQERVLGEIYCGKLLGIWPKKTLDSLQKKQLIQSQEFSVGRLNCKSWHVPIPAHYFVTQYFANQYEDEGT